MRRLRGSFGRRAGAGAVDWLLQELASLAACGVIELRTCTCIKFLCMSLKYYTRQQFLYKEENSAVLELRETDNALAVERFLKISNFPVFTASVGLRCQQLSSDEVRKR